MFDALMLKTPDLKGLRNAVRGSVAHAPHPGQTLLCAPVPYSSPHSFDFPQEGTEEEYAGTLAFQWPTCPTPLGGGTPRQRPAF